MKNFKTAVGACMCKAVSLSFSLGEEVFDACHCSMCRKWGGGPAFTVAGGHKVAFKGEESITTYSSSAWAERGFCKTCGTHLFYRLKETGFYNFPLGIIENNEQLKFHLQIFIDNKPEHYSFENQTALMTEAEVIAKYASK
jgi:hypothetical protein